MVKQTKDEKEIIESYEKDEWQSVKDKKTEMSRYQSYAKATFKKNKRVNIRISSKDLINIQKKALEEGLRYQTLISSVLHKYVSGQLTEK